MTETHLPVLAHAAPPPPPSAASNALVFAWRAVLKIRHVPEQLFDVLLTPILFTLIFTFVFGGALAGSSEAYLQFLVPGILVQTVAFNSVYAGMGLCTDLGRGLYDRFRSMPVWQLAPFAGLVVGDVMRHLIAAGIILAIGLALGYRPPAGAAGVAVGFAVLIALGLGFGWIFLALGTVMRVPTAMMTLGFAVLFPLTFVSNALVDPATMPTWLQGFVAVNPVSLTTTAVRAAMDGGLTAGQAALSLIAPALAAAAFAPLTLWLYRRR